MSHVQILLSIIVGFGILGGVTNFFRIYNTNENKSPWQFIFIKSVLMGICASFSVPLFLQVISNNLLDDSGSVDYSYKNYLILAGFCVLASLTAKGFLENLSGQLASVEAKANEAKQLAQDAEKRSEEIDNIDDINIGKIQNTKFNENEVKKIIKSILASKYTYRTIGGIAKETEMSEEKVLEILNTLKKSGWAKSREGNKGNEVWKITL